MEQSYSLLEKSWIKVELLNGSYESVGLLDLFKRANEIKNLHGDSRMQDFAVFRVLLAILSSATYKADLRDEEAILQYWQKLYQNKDLSQAFKYLKANADKFDFLGDHPFMQVTKDEFNQMVEPKKQITDKSLQKAIENGDQITPISMINRNVKQSGSKLSAIARPSLIHRNDLSMDELVRWIITYQFYAGTADKTKILNSAGKPAKYSVSAGYLMVLVPVFIKGKTLADTLLFNLVMFTKDLHYKKPHPIWNFDVVTDRDKLLSLNVPDNYAELCSYPSRLIYIDYSTGHQLVFMAGIPLFSVDNLFAEPMTTFHWSKGKKAYRPLQINKNTMSIAMWRNFGQYINTTTADDSHIPGIVEWIRILQDHDILPFDYKLNLERIVAVSDGNATSQLPVHVIDDDLTINANIANGDESLIWVPAIEDAIGKSQYIGSKCVYRFGKSLAHDQGGKLSDEYYEALNIPFNNWLKSLNSAQDPDEEVAKWIAQSANIAKAIINNFIKYNLSTHDIAELMQTRSIVFGKINNVVKGLI